MTAPTATADPAIGVNHHVADLTGGARGAAHERAVMDDGPTDAGSDEDANKIGMSPPGSERRLADGRDLDIVAQIGRNLEPPGQESRPSADRPSTGSNSARRAERHARYRPDRRAQPRFRAGPRRQPLLSRPPPPPRCRAGSSFDRQNPRRPSSSWPWPKPRRSQGQPRRQVPSFRRNRFPSRCSFAHLLACPVRMSLQYARQARACGRRAT